jgi:uncharacterized protein YegL
VEPRGKILPIYFVADESGSMGRHIGELNKGLLSLQDALQRESSAAAKVRFSVIGFSDDAFTYLEPADLRTAPQLPELSAHGSTSYCAAFEQLAYRISVDLPRLKGHGFSVYRPVVFFLTDGAPTDREDWRAVRARLLDQPAAPNILSFGIGEADPAVVGEIATKQEFALVADRHMDTGAAITEFLTSLTQSVISSGNAVASGSAELQFDKPEGFTLAVDLIEEDPE